MSFRLLDVERMPCPKRGATGRFHELVNNDLKTYCKHCTNSWKSLDKRQRKTVPVVPESAVLVDLDKKDDEEEEEIDAAI